MSFSSLGLSPPIMKAVAEQGYDTPSPIQLKAIPVALNGRDLMAAAQTGTGKTAGFTLPILEKLSSGQSAQANQVRALVLTPTRELAAQVESSVAAYSKFLPLRSAVVFGGVKINPQMMKLRKGVDILVATPGRLLDLYNQRAVNFKQLEVLVLDEADRMLDMGFIHDIRKILAILPKQRQNLMFSATFSDEIRRLAKGLVNNPVEISVTPRNTTAKSVEQWMCPVDKKQKPALLTQLIKEGDWQQALVFTRTKHGANKLTRHLEGEGIKASAIHGNKSQGARTKALSSFKNGDIRVLVATDIAARGLDIDQLPQVVNFDLPNVPEDYVHRIGRTGRAGATGHAISLVCADEFKQLSDIERLTQKLLARKFIDGFEPVHDVPESGLDRRPMKPKKPKVEHKDGQRSGENTAGRRNSQAKPGSTRRKSLANKNKQTSGKNKPNGKAGDKANNSGRAGSSSRSGDGTRSSNRTRANNPTRSLSNKSGNR